MQGSDPSLSARARTNPVYLTAKTALCLMADAGIEKAEQIADRLGVSVRDYGMEEEDIRLGNELVVEAKYRTMCRLIQDSGYDINVDLPCGYTPKALALTEKGFRFVGLDLPIVTEEVAPLILELANHREDIRFQGVDATNPDSLRAALSGEKGPLCITTEGMMMYFTEDEASQVLKSIRSLLEIFGGCWITPDPEYMLQFFLTFRSVLGENAVKKLLDSRDNASGQSDVSLGGNSFILHPQDLPSSMSRSLGFLKSHGLKAQRLNLAEYMPELSAYKKLTKEQIAAFQAAMRKCHYWKITLEEDQKRGDRGKDSAPFSLEVTRGDQEFTALLRGRMDTLTAPELLEAFERETKKGEIRRVQIRCEQLDYISSAGLRVLLMIRKALPGGELVLTGIKEEVLEILKNTGFDQIFEIQK